MDRARIVELYFASGCSVVAAQRAFRKESGITAPYKHSILCWVNHFRMEGNVANNPYHRGRTARGPKEIAKVGKAIRANPTQSVRGLERKTGVSKSSIQRILIDNLEMFPYKMQLTQKLKRGDKTKRLKFCHWFLEKLQARHSFLDSLWMSDEANFHLDGTVSKQNFRYWSKQQPHIAIAHDMFPSHLTVWCAISSKGVIGPYFFEEHKEVVTVNAYRYSNMLERFFVRHLRRRKTRLGGSWFQQDGAKPHTAKYTMEHLHKIFQNRIISKGADVTWPPRSPDLTAPDFFLWGYVKAIVYSKPVHSLGQLKKRIRKCIKDIPSSTVLGAMQSLATRCRECIHRRGGLLDSVIFKN